MRPPAVPMTGRPLRFRLGSGCPPVRPPDVQPIPLPSTDEPPLDPTDPAVPTEDPLDDPPELGRSVAVPDDEDPGGGLRPCAIASWGIPRPTAPTAPTATSTAISL